MRISFRTPTRLPLVTTSALPALLFMTVLVGVAAFAPRLQGEALSSGSCDSTDCDFPCTDPTDPWTSETDGVWFIIHARPKYDTGTSVVDMVWKDSEGQERWVPMTVVGTWTNSQNPNDTIQASVDIDSGGDCSQGSLGNPDYIRCHGNISETELCDNYGGVWEYDQDGQSEGFCVDEYRYGVDFGKEIEDNGETYCWTEVGVLTQNPQGYGLVGYANCGSNQPLEYQQTEENEYSCTTGETRGGASRIHFWVDYLYHDPE